MEHSCCRSRLTAAHAGRPAAEERAYGAGERLYLGDSPARHQNKQNAVFRQVVAFLLLPQPLDRCEPDTTPRSGGPGTLFLAPPGQTGNARFD